MSCLREFDRVRAT